MAAMNRRVQDRVRQRLANLRRNRLILDRTNPLEVLSGDQIFERYRFLPDTIVSIVRHEHPWP